MKCSHPLFDTQEPHPPVRSPPRGCDRAHEGAKIHILVISQLARIPQSGREKNHKTLGSEKKNRLGPGMFPTMPPR